jgi:hypothetical protein
MPHAPHPVEPHRSARLPLALVLGVAAGLVYVFVTVRFVNNEARALLTPTLTARQAAEAGVHKALYCLNAASVDNCGGTSGGRYRGETGVVFGDASFTTTVSGTGHERVIDSVGLVRTASRYSFTASATDLPPNETIDLAYSLLAGPGGISLGSKAVVSGNVRSAGDIRCQGGATMKGTAVVSRPDGLIDGCVVTIDSRPEALGDAKEGAETDRAATPAEVPLPSLDLELWTKAAAAGGTKDGGYHPTNGERLGPLKVKGDLIIGRNVSVQLNGPLWATGKIVVERGAKVTLNKAYGRYGTVLLAYDPANSAAGRVLIEDGAVFTGSGTAGSLLLAFAAAGDSSPAMTVAGKPGEIVLMAPNGLLRLSDRASVLSAVARQLEVGQRAAVKRLPFLGPASFATKPGGVWNLRD